MKLPSASKAIAIGVSLAFVGLVVAWNPGDGLASAQPSGSDDPPRGANKIAVSGASFKEIETPLTSGSYSAEVELLRAYIKTADPTDLIIEVNAECALMTDVVVTGNGDSEAIGSVRVWVTLDGVTIPVSADDRNEVGRVVFCDRAFRMAIQDLDDEDAVFRQYLKTRSANSFTWVTLDVGHDPNPHEIVVWAQLKAEVNGMGEAKAGVGKRTLIVEPVMLSNDATI